MHSAIFLGYRHSLHAMHALLIAHLSINIFACPARGGAFYFETRLLISGQVAFGFIINLPTPALFFRKFLVHMCELPGEKRSLVASGTGPDFQHYFIRPALAGLLFLIFR